jgi:hypothetical protein
VEWKTSDKVERRTMRIAWRLLSSLDWGGGLRVLVCRWR